MSQKLPVDPAALASIPLFHGLPPEVMEWLRQVGEIRQYSDGETIVEEGAPADKMQAVVRGSTRNRVHDSQEDISYRLETGNVGGALPYSRLQVFPAKGIAVGHTVLYLLPRSQFPMLEKVSPELVQRLVAFMNDRARNEVRTQERDEKLRALGKLSAGLSHELNNPAAAVSRAATTLAVMLDVLPLVLTELLSTSPPAKPLAALTSLGAGDILVAPGRSGLQTADLEEEMAAWLETEGCPNGEELATSLVQANITVAQLQPIAEQLTTASLCSAFTWLSKHLLAKRVLRDMGEASRRISSLVNDIKTYSHMDRALGRERLAVTDGLESTLNIFAFALRQKNVHLTRDYALDLPLVMGQAGSLNQVWTNLIDNALDALPAQGGELTVTVGQKTGCIYVRIRDNGPGIPPEIVDHIFEPFFTTKPRGEGSGQGLDIARHIVQEHSGHLEVFTQPGCTQFTVWLPIG